VHAGAARTAFAIFIDDGHHFRHRPTYPGTAWQDRGPTQPSGSSPSVLWARWPQLTRNAYASANSTSPPRLAPDTHYFAAMRYVKPERLRLTRPPRSASPTSSRRRRTPTATLHERLEPVSERDRPSVTTHAYPPYCRIGAGAAVVAVVPRGSDGLVLEPACRLRAAWLINDVPACRFPCRGVAHKRCERLSGLE
jgi:hypothetical protein